MNPSNFPGVVPCLKGTDDFDVWFDLKQPGYYLNETIAKTHRYNLHEKRCHHLKDKNNISTNSNTKYAAIKPEPLLDMAKAAGTRVGPCSFWTKRTPQPSRPK